MRALLLGSPDRDSFICGFVAGGSAVCAVVAAAVGSGPGAALSLVALALAVVSSR